MTEPKPRKRAVVRVSYDLLKDLLFPDGTTILGIIEDAQSVFALESVDIVVEHPDLPDVAPNTYLPIAHPVYTRHHREGDGEVIRVEFTGWGIK